MMQEPLPSNTQLQLWEYPAGATTSETASGGIRSILFRNSVPEIKSTTAGTFGIYKYPAKFIPQVIAYIIKQYATPGMSLFDPFAGYGTVGVVARVYGQDYELWDLNPLMQVIHDAQRRRCPRFLRPTSCSKCRVPHKPLSRTGPTWITGTLTRLSLCWDVCGDTFTPNPRRSRNFWSFR